MVLNMKKLLLATICLLVLGSPLFAQKKAADYMNTIGKEFKDITNDMWAYTSSAAYGKPALKVESKRKELLKQISASMNKIKKMDEFEGDTRFRDSAIAFLQLNFDVLNEDYARIIELQGLSQDSYEAMENYMKAQDLIDEKIDKAGKMIGDEEQKFASDYGIKLSDKKSKTAIKIEAAARVYKYYNPIYLIFFKCYKDESYLIDAQNKADLEMMDKCQAWLTETSTQGLEELKTIKDFDGDNTLKTACMDLLKFYQLESGKRFLENKGFFVKKDKYNKAKEVYDSKSEETLTKAEISAYKKATNDYNNALTKYNVNNQILSDQRKRLIDAWNKVIMNFTNKHIPK